MTQDERDAASLARRLDLLRAPVVALRRHARLKEPWVHDERFANQPWRDCVAGVGPDGTALAFWPSSEPEDGPPWGVVTSDAHAIVVEGVPSVAFVQPLPGGAVLLSAARARRDEPPSAGVWDAHGHRTASGSLGDAALHVLTTPSGQVWVGYFDEALGGSGPSGLARFGPDLVELWRVDDPRMPYHDDCYALSVDGEVAVTYAYTAFHLTRVDASGWEDLGQAPHHFAHGLLIDGDRAVLVGGPSPAYDLLTPLVRRGDEWVVGGPAQRLVLPNGLEVDAREVVACRGSRLHVVHRRQHLVVDLDDIAFTN